jgi:prepilin-type N-terminal cleavage/methylation domain-containing protein
MKRGYSIVEVLVAVAILSIVLPGLVRWVVSSRQTQVGSYRSEQATEFAQAVFDSLRDVPCAIRTPTSGTAATKNGMAYTLSWGYVDAAGSAYTGTKPGAAWVNVQWTVGKVTRNSRLNGVLP